MCEPVSIASAAIGGLGAISGHQQASAAVDRSNRAKLLNYNRQVEERNRTIMFDEVKHDTDIQVADIEQDQVYQAMIDQWTQHDQQLDQIFAQSNFKIENAIIEMHENDYAGTQTGATAARLAGKSAKKLGQFKAKELAGMMMAAEQTGEQKRLAAVTRDNKSREIYEKIRYQPVHGLEPMRPEMDPKPSAAGMILGLAGAAVGGFESARDFKAKDISKNKSTKTFDSSSIPSYNQNWNYTSGSAVPFNTDWSGL